MGLSSGSPRSLVRAVSASGWLIALAASCVSLAACTIAHRSVPGGDGSTGDGVGPETQPDDTLDDHRESDPAVDALDALDPLDALDALDADGAVPPDVADPPDGADVVLLPDVATCPDGGTACGARCVDLATDVSNCGACGRVCPGIPSGSPSCATGTCAITCDAGFVLTSGACVPDPARARTCPGLPIVASAGEERVVVGTTAGSGADTVGTGGCAGALGDDAVFAITASVTGTLYLRLDTATFDAQLYVRRTCDTASTQVACENDVPRAGEESLSLAVTAGTTVYVFVDALAGAAGAFALRHRIGVCGDGLLDAGENCDDGNTASMDGCSSACAVEALGTPRDACDVGMPRLPMPPGRHAYRGTTTGAMGTLTGSCSNNRGADVVYVIEPTISGTLRVALFPDSGFNGSIYAAPACDTLSTTATCSNRSGAGRWENLEFAVTAGTPVAVVVDTHDGGAGGFQIVFSLTRCGDGFPAAGEQCDDGNVVDGDGCSASCRNETACVVAETEPNGAPATAMASPRCGYVRVNGAVMPRGDQDYTTLSLRAGQLVEIETFESGTGDCRNNPDTIIELHPSPLMPPPGNNNCGGATGLACNDDQYGGLFCSQLRFAAPLDGTYFMRTYWYQHENTTAAYSVGIRTVR